MRHFVVVILEGGKIMSDVQIVSKKVFGLNELRELVETASDAIGTWLLPKGELSYYSIRDFVNTVTQINLGRRFAESGFSEAYLELCMESHIVQLRYRSTSGTQIKIRIVMDNNQNIQHIWFDVLLPKDRAYPGRIHYEKLTATFLPYSEFVYFPTPEWVDRKQFEDYFVNGIEFFQKRNFQQAPSEMGLVWKRDDLVVKPLEEPTGFLVVWYDQYREKNKEEFIEGYYSLDEFLNREPRKPNPWRKRRKSSVEEDIDADEEYEELEELSYDEPN